MPITLLPTVIDDSRLDTYLKILELSRAPKSLDLDWSRVQRVSPAGHGILACLMDACVEQKKEVISKAIAKTLLLLPSVRSFATLRGSHAQGLPPLAAQYFCDPDTLVEGVAGHVTVGFLEKMQSQFQARLSDEVMFSARLILSELIQNSADHSTAERYYLYAGIWESEFHCGCLDMGVGIPAKLSQIYECQSDVEFLKLALKRGVTTRRQRVGGLGLYYFFEKLKSHRAKLTILSRGAQVRKYFATGRSQESKLKHTLWGTWLFARFPIALKSQRKKP